MSLIRTEIAIAAPAVFETGFPTFSKYAIHVRNA
jgi:hypothetical protein